MINFTAVVLPPLRRTPTWLPGRARSAGLLDPLEVFCGPDPHATKRRSEAHTQPGELISAFGGTAKCTIRVTSPSALHLTKRLPEHFPADPVQQFAQARKLQHVPLGQHSSTSRPRLRRLPLHCGFWIHSAFPQSLWKAEADRRPAPRSRCDRQRTCMSRHNLLDDRQA
jgi:hypothetical protein